MAITGYEVDQVTHTAPIVNSSTKVRPHFAAAFRHSSLHVLFYRRSVLSDNFSSQVCSSVQMLYPIENAAQVDGFCEIIMTKNKLNDGMLGATS